jgi:hypothetical protein
MTFLGLEHFRDNRPKQGYQLLKAAYEGYGHREARCHIIMIRLWGEGPGSEELIEELEGMADDGVNEAKMVLVLVLSPYGECPVGRKDPKRAIELLKECIPGNGEAPDLEFRCCLQVEELCKGEYEDEELKQRAAVRGRELARLLDRGWEDVTDQYRSKWGWLAIEIGVFAIAVLGVAVLRYFLRRRK